MTDIGRPYMIITDSAQEEIKSQKWLKLLREFFIKKYITEAGHQHQNRAERFVQVLKSRGGNLFHRCQDCTTLYDNYLFKYVCDL